MSPGPAYDPLVSPAAGLAPVAAAPPAHWAPLPGNHQAQPLPSADVQNLISQLESLGAAQFQLTSWGSDGAMHRFECCAPLPGESGFVRHFDAIEPDAQLAVSRVFRDVQQWRAQLATQPR